MTDIPLPIPTSTFYQDITDAALSVVPDMGDRLLIHVEIEDHIINSAIFYENEEKRVICLYSPEALELLLYSFWEKCQSSPHAWQVASFHLTNEKFTMTFTYPNQLVAGEDLSYRRFKAVKAFFGDVMVDYSNAQLNA